MAGSRGDRRAYDRLLREGVDAARHGRHEDAARASAAALTISRRLYAESGDTRRDLPALAAAAYNHGGAVLRLGDTGTAASLLAEAAGYYAQLAAGDAAFRVAQADVRTRMGLVHEAQGRADAAIADFSAAVDQYRSAHSADAVDRTVGECRALLHRGRRRLWSGSPQDAADALTDLLDGAKGLGDLVRGRRTAFGRPGWLRRAPEQVAAVAPLWAEGLELALPLVREAGRRELSFMVAAMLVDVTRGMIGLFPDGRFRHDVALLRQQDLGGS